MERPLTWPVGSGLAVALLACACASSADKPAWLTAIATTRPAASELAVAWVNTELRPIGQPVAVGSVVVGIVSTGNDKVFLVGLDPATGGKLWQKPITSSGVAPGVTLEPTKVGTDKVAYFRPIDRDSRNAELVIADARTGNDLAKAPKARFNSPPIVCDNGNGICTTWSTADGVRHGQLDIATGRYRVNKYVLPGGTRVLSLSGLLDLGLPPDGMLTVLRDGEPQWLTAVGLAFPPGFSSRNGWAWHLFAEQHVLAGSVGGKATVTGWGYVLDLQDTSTTAGLSELTGEVLWSDRGSTFDCHLGKSDYAVRCRVHGTVRWHDGSSVSYRSLVSYAPSVSYEGLDVTVEGFDVTTGITTWAVPMGAAQTLVMGRRYPAIAGATAVIVNATAGPVLLDYVTGETKAPAPGATFWCMTRTEYEVSDAYWIREEPIYTRAGGMLAAICDDCGRPATALPSLAATMAAGASTGSYAVVAVQHGFIGFKAR